MGVCVEVPIRNSVLNYMRWGGGGGGWGREAGAPRETKLLLRQN